MKNLITKLVVLSVVLAFCLPAYGDILVYKTATKGIEFDLAGNEMEKTKDRGYLVLDIDLATQAVTSAQHVTYWKNDDDEQRTEVVTVEFYDDVDDYIVVDYMSSDTDAVLYGKAKETDVGLTADKDVAKSLKGYMLVFENDLGTGSIRAKLDTKLTKAANETADPIATVVAAIVTGLTDDGYTPIVDTTPPTPSPMEWATGGEPAATGATTITMTAETATDADTPPVKYYFTNVTDSGHNSGWQSGATFNDSGLTPNTTYTYNVKAKDSAPVPNETLPSTPDVNATTDKIDDTNAPLPNPMEWATGGEPNAISETEITMTAADACDPQGVEYYFTNVTDSNHNSGWKDEDIDDLPQWTAGTRTWIDIDLTPATMYAYTVTARDKALVTNVTAPSTPNDVNATTDVDADPPTPDPMTWSTEPEANGATAIYMVATTADDADPNVYYFFEFVFGGAGGTDSPWQTSPIYQDTGLDPNTEYGYRVKAKDVTGNTTVESTIEVVKTTLTIQLMIDQAFALRDANKPPVTVTVPAGIYIEDPVIDEPNLTLQSASGNATIQLVTGVGIDIQATADNVTIGGSSGHGFNVICNVTNTTSAVQVVTDNVEISYNTFDSNGNATEIISVGAAGADDLTISDNTMTLDDDADVAVALLGTINDLDVNNNTITSLSTTADANSIVFNEVTVEGATIRNNTITGATSQIQLGAADMNDILYTENVFTDTAGAIRVVETTDPTPINEVQTVTLATAPNNVPDGGTFTLRYDGQTTTAIPWNAAAATIDANLAALSNVAPGDITASAAFVDGTTFTFLSTLGDVNMLVADTNLLLDGIDVVTASFAETATGLDTSDRLMHLDILDNTFGTGSPTTMDSYGFLIDSTCEDGDPDWATIQVTGNTFQIGMRLGGAHTFASCENGVGGPGVLDAELNWWNAADGPSSCTNCCGTGDTLSDDVDFENFCTNAACTADANCP